MPKNKEKIKKKPAVKSRLTAAQRRLEILQAAVPLFAREGFRGVTTKQLAQCAGVSEALLYQHFPSKEVLYSEVQEYCCAPSEALRKIIEGLQPSTETLVLLLFFLTKVVIEKRYLTADIDPLFPRLMLHSLLDDGEFARLHLARASERMVALMLRSFAAASASGDLQALGEDDELLFWFCHHTLVAIDMYQLPPIPVVPYHSSKAQLIEPVMRYMLRGIGLTPPATQQYLKFEQLTDKVNAWFGRADEG